ncbi:MAG: sugar ABC transporter ATP-binding protein [Spirochaetaceae bacterium]|jgi:ribose transport system ATP-binding protein|nr:sugar ABC transporter ATP-binding protein [Spirochaetaceae bacterium]
MALLQARNITKVFPGVTALDRVNLDIESGRIHCVIGENGAGKSTLIKILMGIYAADGGELIIDGRTVDASNKKDRKYFDRIAYVPQELDLFTEMSVAENLFMPYKSLGASGRIDRRKLESDALPWLERFKITARPGALVKNISVSERQMLQIVRSMTNTGTEILLLDEPTTSLTTNETDRLFEVLKELRAQGKAIIFISHKLEEIFAIGDTLTILRNGVRVAEAHCRDVDIPWVISHMAGSELSQEETYRPQRTGGGVLLKVRGLTGAKFRNIDFDLHRGEILGFSGLVGSGRTEIMQALFGYLPVWSGEAFFEGQKWNFGSTTRSVKDGLVYMPEERKQQGILPQLSVKKNISVALLDKIKEGFYLSKEKETAITRDVVDAYNIKIASFEQLIQFLSGGNQQKVIIGRAMFSHPKALVFDEPTKGIDVGSKAEIYKLMKRLAEETQIGIILISSELNELLKCSNRIITIYFGEKQGESAYPFDKEQILNEIMGMKRHAHSGAA